MKQWQTTLIQQAVSLEDAIRTLNDSGMRILLVVDEQRRLLGTVTDGDIRRALMAHAPLSSPVSAVMHNEPITARMDWSKANIQKAMDRHQVLQMPVLNYEDQVIGLETLYSLRDTPKKDNLVFLMAGGFGTRLRPLTNDCPKPMLMIGGKPILETILESFIAAGFHRFCISTHYRGEMIRDHFGDGDKWGVSIDYVDEKDPLGTAGALSLLPDDKLDAPVFVMNGDLLTQLNFTNLLDFHVDNAAVATMCVREYEYQVPYGVISSVGHQITSIVEKPVQKFFINAGIYLLSPEMIASIPKEERVDMPELIESAMQDGQTVNMFPLHEYWLDIGRMEDFKKAQLEFLAL
ncbi:nucleotidyltransferase family protein [Salinispirillum marinum]|uniref:Nucleotidyltransferase family protein n=2 Tax=Saccharospirillaceae TaxID=255527 RepID=A0ABV8BI01_9GAMM